MREQIAKQAALAEKGMSAEEFLGSAEKVLGPLAAGVSLLPVAELGHKLGSGLGIGTSKSRVEQFDLPVGRVIVGALCSLARRGMAIDTVEQGEDGCLIEAAMPSSAFILAGTLAIVVSREGSGARVEAAAKVTGQMFDWGASRKSLSNLFTDIGRFAPAEIVG